MSFESRRQPDSYQYYGGTDPLSDLFRDDSQNHCDRSRHVSKKDRKDWRPDHSDSEAARRWREESEARRRQPIELNRDGTYTAHYGDSLETVAERLLRHNGCSTGRQAIDRKVEKLVALNKNCHPSLEENRDFLGEGWKIRVGGETSSRRHVEEEAREPGRRHPEAARYQARQAERSRPDVQYGPDMQYSPDVQHGRARRVSYPNSQFGDGSQVAQSMLSGLASLPFMLLGSQAGRRYGYPGDCDYGYGYRGYPGSNNFNSTLLSSGLFGRGVDGSRYYDDPYGYGRDPYRRTMHAYQPDYYGQAGYYPYRQRYQQNNNALFW